MCTLNTILVHESCIGISIELFLTSFFIFHPLIVVDANNACKLTCNDANCDLCSDADTCTTCAAGYHVDSSNLVYVAPHGEKVFDGMCSYSSDQRLLVLAGLASSDKNPGTDWPSRVQACANACLNKRIITPLTYSTQPSWDSFVAKGFVVRDCYSNSQGNLEDCGRCYCESNDPSTCSPRQTTGGFKRYDLTAACSGSHPDCAACVARTCDDANCDLCSAADTCMTCASGYELNANNACKLTCNDANCDTCSSADTCTTCASGYRGENSSSFFIKK